jgi:hypothetical protein
MTDAADKNSPFDIPEQLARIEQALADAHKLRIESEKYAAETRRLDREYRWFPWLNLGVSGVAAIAAIVAAVVAHMK